MRFVIELELDLLTEIIKNLKYDEKQFQTKKYKNNKKKERFNSEETERKETKEDNTKCVASKPNHANLFAALD